MRRIKLFENYEAISKTSKFGVKSTELISPYKKFVFDEMKEYVDHYSTPLLDFFNGMSIRIRNWQVGKLSMYNYYLHWEEGRWNPILLTDNTKEELKEELISFVEEISKNFDVEIHMVTNNKKSDSLYTKNIKEKNQIIEYIENYFKDDFSKIYEISITLS